MFSGEIDSHYIVERHSLVVRWDKMIGSVEIAKGIKGAKMSDIKSTQNKDQAMRNVNTESSLDSTSQTQIPAESKLANLPIALFASVMGIGGLSLVLKKASVAFGSAALANASFNSTALHSGANALESSLDSSPSWQGVIAPFLWWGACSFAVLAVVVFALLLVCYSAKMLYHSNAFKADLKHQVKINFLSSIPISMLIIVAFWSDLSSGVDLLWQGILGLFYVASALQLVLSLYVMSFWFKESMKSALLSPAWFIPIVGNLIVPLSGGLIIAPKELLLFFFSIGCFFWILLSAMIMQRLIFEQSLESKFIPTLFIFIAPPSIFVVDFHSLFGVHNALSLIGFNVALFFVLLLLSLGNIFTKLNFAPSWWAFTFPLCAFGIASFDLYMIEFKCFYGLLGILGLVMAFFAVVFISYKTLRAVVSGAIFKDP
ncbi:C4-dicarboxylate transporter/malic acid transport protein [Helicobacter canis]|uniref:C4-dicarboxylate transporter/malic acid transport protein n=2 Tax=Helicobacter canis TaxID=29419 RepID=A0A377J608_9HELI|nr:C4-dicarboxylate transporter/malic acid transport protein [Helicobacter canis]